MNHASDIWRQMQGAPLRIFLICLAGWTLTNLDQSLFAYTIPGIRADFGVDLNTIAGVLSVSFAFSAFAAVAIGVLADRYGRKIMFIVSLGASALLVGLQGFAPDVWTLAVLRTLSFGMSNGMAALVMTYTSEAAPARYRGLITGFLGVGYPIGWFVASLAAAPVMQEFGWRTTFFIAFAVLPPALLLFRFLPESGRFEKARSVATTGAPWTAQLKELMGPTLRNRTVLSVLSFFAFGGAYAGTAFLFPTFYIETRGYSEADATYIVGMSYFIGLGGYFASSIVGEFYMTRRNTVVLWYWLGALGLLGVIWLPEGKAEDILWFGIMATFFYGSQAVVGVFMTELFPTHVRATGVAVGTFGLYAGFGVFPLVVSAVVGVAGWQWAFTLVPVPLLLIAGAVLFGVENIKSGVELEQIPGERKA